MGKVRKKNKKAPLSKPAETIWKQAASAERQ